MKIKKLIVCFFASINFALTALAQIPTNGLVGYYPFTGDANDMTANAQNGTVNGATLTIDRFGNANSAYYFDGSAGYISIPAINFLSNEYSYSYWMKSTVNPTTAAYAYSIGTPTQGGAEIAGGLNNTTAPGIEGYCYTTAGGIPQPVYSGTLPVVNRWYHIVFARNSSTLKLYVDGIVVDSISTTGTTPQYGTGPYVFNIGTRFDLTYYFNGSLDDFRIYNRAVNSAEVKELYNESICFQTVTVTDTLVINANITSFNPLTYNSTIKVYPNPTNDHLTIDNGNYTSLTGYTIKITNSLGQSVFTSLINQQQFSIDLSTWTTGNGLYFVYITDAQNNLVDVKKIVLQ